jgi:hypothetical protein
MRDLMNYLSAKVVMGNGAQINTTTHSDAVDVTSLNGGNEGLMFLVEVGTITDGTHVFTLEDSYDGGSTWTTVATPYVQTPSGQSATVTSATAAKTVLKFGYLGNPNVPAITKSAGYPVTNPNGNKVQVRTTNTCTPGSTGGYMTVTAVLGYAANEPAA